MGERGLHFHLNFFKDQLAISFRKGSWDFHRDCTESVGQFGSIAILIMLSPLLHEHEMSFHLFRFSLIFSAVFRGFKGTYNP